MTKSKEYNKVAVKDNMKVNNSEVEEVQDKPEGKNLNKIVSAEPKKVKRGLVNRLVTGIVGPEGLPGVGDYINNEIIKPAIKNLIVDTVTSGINRLMYGPGGGGYRGAGYRPTGNGGYRPNTNYSANYRHTTNQPQPVQQDSRVRNARYVVEEYIIEDRYDASHVLVSLTENADMYGTVSVADYYDLIGVNSHYTDNNYGWTHDSIKHASVVPTRGGFVIRFPSVEVI